MPTDAVELAPTISLRGLVKRFAGVTALDGVDLDVLPGEVHGLLGENGSGKSTLIKVLSGFHDVDDGTLAVAGTPVALPLSAGLPQALGLQFVHQDLGLIESLTVVENLNLTAMASARWRIDWRAERRRAREVFARYGFELDPAATVADIRPVQRAQLAIARAMEGMRDQDRARGLLVLDEPTVFLPREEAEQLFALVREIVAGGSSVLFVSHDLEEILRVTDRVTVLRDGRLVGTEVTADTSQPQLVEMIVGRALEVLAPAGVDRSGVEVAYAVRGVTGGQLVDVSLDVRRGEVLGLTGLLGSGFDELVYLLYGAQLPRSGSLRHGDREIDLTSATPARSIAAGTVLVPADRKNDGSVPSLSATDNLTVPVLGAHMRRGRLRRGELRRHTATLMAEFDVRPCRPELPYSAFSGGNQQKVLLAKWLQLRPSLLLLHEPTQGVDVGARQQIYAFVRAAAQDGGSVVCASADHDQLAAVCDRVVVFGRGRIVAELVGTSLTSERITEKCFSSMSTAPEAQEVG